MLHPLLAMGLGLDAEGATAMVVKGLAVGGGFLVGYFLGGAVAWALDRWVFAQKAPPQVKKAVALLAGVAVAVVLGMILFGEGGKGLLGRGGESDKKGTTSPADNNQKATPEKKVEPKKDEPPAPKVAPTPTPGDLHITILGGGEVAPDRNGEGRFFLIEGDPEPKSLPQLQEAVAERRRDKSKPVPVLVFRFKDAMLSASHPEMKKLTAWLQEAKILNRFE